MEWWLNGIVIGLIATVVMDAWAVVAKHVLRLPTSDWAFVGRWFGHMPSGKFVHRKISDAAPIRGELVLGWTAHYLIGVAYGVAYVWLAREVLRSFPALVSALLFAYAMLVFPWLVMQPALGAGVFASRVPRPNLTRTVSFSMHTVFGIGLYIGARLLAAI